ncbi:MAG: hypothetical protein OES84_04580 [Kiritimatiellaceae bacterium]|nr:hypothetical protein [Kiritimatiellaceae bacterium]
MSVFEQKAARSAKVLKLISSCAFRSSVGLFLLFVTGCSTIPFEPEPKGDFRGLEPSAVVEEFGASVGQDFELLESMVFKFFTKGFTGLGYLSIDPQNEAYTLSCMTPTGVSIFGLRGQGDAVEPLFVPPPMEKHQDKIFNAIGQDLRRIYLDWVPPDEAKVKHKKDRMVFEHESVEWTFSGIRRLLTEKRFSRGWKTDAVVRYFDYEDVNGKLYPMGVILYNKRFHYRMIFRVKEIYPAQTSREL